MIAFLKNYLKVAPPMPGYSLDKRLMTLHLAPPKHKFYDTTLNRNVGYAKHAISIDENRADFQTGSLVADSREAGPTRCSRQSLFRASLVSGRRRRHWWWLSGE
ncbi:DUF2235 domain-containing protein [Bradyrhizobium sp. CW10]|nr:DUF2235 domain-containing protein [Bradyrhizobium sp. CW10]